jgi:sugar phosphate isomerase/epimerase
MLVGYHNHFVEFAELEGEAPWDTFFRNTNPSVVMQLDTGNAMAGKADVVSILKRYPGRAVTVHLKPFAPEAADSDLAAGFRPMIGEDGVPWDEVFSLCETTAGTEWYIVEYESDAYPPIQAVDVCLRTLRRMGR